MGIIYIAHRLFALHDRMLAATLADKLAKQSNWPIFLPYCDTKEDTVIVPKKGFYLFQEDVKRLQDLKSLVAILHGPGYDDGVCMEIGFAYRMGVPLVFLTTDFLTYSFGRDSKQFVMSDPLLEALNAKILQISDPASEGTETPNHSKYQQFYNRNERSLDYAIDEAVGQVLSVGNQQHVKIPARANKKKVYMEVSPYGFTEHIDRFKHCVEKMGWEFYCSSRFTQAEVSTEEATHRDLHEALESSILILDGNGPEVPIGSSVLAGISLAEKKKTILLYTGSQVTHAHGREENARNLMLLYGCSAMAQTPKQAEEMLVSEILSQSNI